MLVVIDSANVGALKADFLTALVVFESKTEALSILEEIKGVVMGRQIREARAALREAGCLRFRPVMLTSITTIGGLLPLLLEKSFQAQFLIPMATALAFGLMMTTLLVLILVPVLYSFFGTSAREEHEDEYAEGFAPALGGSSVDPDAAEQEWLPEHLREPAVK